MTFLPSIDTASTGLRATSTWLERIAHNIANVNTQTTGEDEPFRASHPVFAEDPNGGVLVAGVVADPTDPAQVADPSAGPDGVANRPVVDLAAEMVDMVIANRSYQSNLRTVQAARERYEAALRLGR